MTLEAKTLALTDYDFKSEGHIDKIVTYELTIKGYLTKEVIELLEIISCSKIHTEKHTYSSIPNKEGELK